MSNRRTVAALALAGAVLAAPAAFAQQGAVTRESVRATESMKMDAINRTSEEAVKEQQKSMPQDSEAAKKAMQDKMDMEKDKKMDAGKAMGGMK